MKNIKIGISRWAVLYAVLALVIGVIIGAVDALFGRGLIFITETRDAHPLYFLPFLALAGLLIVYVYQRFGKDSQKGMGLIFEAGNKGREDIPKRLVPLIIFSTWLSHLFGASVGREGVAVQIGATIGHTVGGKLSSKEAQKVLLITGMAAGFAGLFQTPIAATFFAIEILMVGKIEYIALFPALVGSYAASATSRALGLEKFSFAVNTDLNIDPLVLLKLLVVAICFGLVGRIFAQGLAFMKTYMASKLTNPYRRILLMGFILSLGLIFIHLDRYAGLGTNLISMSFNGEHINAYDWLLKLLFTVLSISAGFQGGEVTPLFAIGASLGATLALLLGLPVGLVAAAGYVSVFSSATNSYFASIFIAAEVFGFGTVQYILPIVTIAYILNGNASIYAQGKLNLEV
ncbi:chloride channel protein [Lactococcus garvieae]|uniref:Voltage-gated chloride channel protein n=1 Tax=Lactococcus garvieae TaxID=1363 RepID=A0A6L2ZUU3_9LACT|nr:chloride channel protein [Lactococcus garvieae]GFO51546.1 voltage-gated chloride channel protein [Lactococcus garvieae]